MWAPPPDQESADVLRRTAWGIYMAGGYQTAGETCRRGTNIWPDTGGGWLNGRGDDTMTMFLGFGHMVISSSPASNGGGRSRTTKWSTMAPIALLNQARFTPFICRGAERLTIKLGAGTYDAQWFSPLSGEKIVLPAVAAPSWTSPDAPDRNDWALLLLSKK